MLLVVFVAARAAAVIVPPGFSAATFAGGLVNATAMAFAPDGRLFVCQQGGDLRVIENGALLTNAFLHVTVDSAGERGLLGVAFDPDFANNHFVYVYYTATTPAIHNRVSRFVANGNAAVPGSESVLLDLNDLSTATNHNGGAIHFGEDGKLYIAVGENANGANSQTLTNLLGKMLRINADGTIPTDNPFYNTATGVNRAIWAMGLRNPFTFAFQPGTGRMFINDVGQSTWEEVDDGIAGSNYGWPTTEGATNDPRFRSPLYVYNHTTGDPTGCAIVGAAFYNAPVNQFPTSYIGKYFFADLCGGWIRYLDPANPSTSTAFATGLSSPVDLQVGPDGSLYYLERGTGSVGTIQYDTATQRVQAVVLDRNRKPLAGAEVHLYDLDNHRFLPEQATTFAPGTVTLDNIPAGRYHIGAFKSGYDQWIFSPSFQGWTVASSLIGPIEIVLDKIGANGGVQGFVRYDDATGAHPIGLGVHIDIYDGGRLFASTDSDANGHYQVNGLPAINIDGAHPWWGWYTYIATWNGHTAVGVNFGIWGGAPIRMDIPFQL